MENDFPKILKAEVTIIWTGIKIHKYVLWSIRLTVFFCALNSVMNVSKAIKDIYFFWPGITWLANQTSVIVLLRPSVEIVSMSDIEILHIWGSQKLKITSQMRYRNVLLSICDCFLSLLVYIGKTAILITRDSLSQCLSFLTKQYNSYFNCRKNVSKLKCCSLKNQTLFEVLSLSFKK